MTEAEWLACDATRRQLGDLFRYIKSPFDRKQRLANQERLRELADRHGDEIVFLCSHDPKELAREQAKASPAAA